MADGTRDAFIESEGDVYGNYAVGVNPLGRLANKRSKKRSKKRKKRSIRSYFKRGKRKSRTVKHRSRRRKHIKRSGKIKYTKRGQPYKIMPNGRARFLKK